mmetsp:Transcript_70909/g.134027  ORF Transcript_70909/g.134027 Transcript_70909/m.134027 type:complete len:166 (+) Transcript_70909:55-552(+)
MNGHDLSSDTVRFRLRLFFYLQVWAAFLNSSEAAVATTQSGSTTEGLQPQCHRGLTLLQARSQLQRTDNPNVSLDVGAMDSSNTGRGQAVLARGALLVTGVKRATKLVTEYDPSVMALTFLGVALAIGLTVSCCCLVSHGKGEEEFVDEEQHEAWIRMGPGQGSQ